MTLLIRVTPPSKGIVGAKESSAAERAGMRAGLREPLDKFSRRWA